MLIGIRREKGKLKRDQGDEHASSSNRTFRSADSRETGPGQTLGSRSYTKRDNACEQCPQKCLAHHN